MNKVTSLALIALLLTPLAAIVPLAGVEAERSTSVYKQIKSSV